MDFAGMILIADASKAFQPPFAQNTVTQNRQLLREGEFFGMSSKQTIFLSYAHEDAAIALQIKRILELNGFKIWIDRQSLGVGMEWSSEIQEAVEGLSR